MLENITAPIKAFFAAVVAKFVFVKNWFVALPYGLKFVVFFVVLFEVLLHVIGLSHVVNEIRAGR